MLDLLRRAVKSWVAQVLLGLLVVSFAVWGIGDVAGGFSSNVATVGGQKIEANTFARALRREQQRFGVDPTEIRSTGLDRFVLGQLVRDAALADAMEALGVSAPDAAIARQVRADPAFQIAGAFDATQYASAVRTVFPSVAAYEAAVRRSLAAQHVALAATAGAVAPHGAAAAILAFRQERRAFDAITLRADALPPVSEPTEADLAAHLQANPTEFATPETRAVTWALIDPAAVAGPIDEADLRAYYEERRADLEQPETRVIDQIVYGVEAEASAARDRLDAGLVDFDALLAERGLSRADAALGAVTARELPDARSEAAFALTEPGVAGPAPTATGFALLDVRAITPGVIVPFEALRDDIARTLAFDRGGPQADRLAERAEDLRAGGASLEEVATDLGVALASLDALTPSGPSDVARADALTTSPAFLAEAFAAEPGRERDMVRLPDGGYLLLRVDAVTPTGAPALEAVRAEVAANWSAQAQREALAVAAEAARSRIADGAPLAQVAADLGATVEPLGPLRREDPDPRLGAEARASLFAASPGAVAVTVARDSATVAVLREVLAPPAQTAAEQALAAQLAATVAQDQLEYLGRALENRAGVSVNPTVFEAALAQIGA